MSKFKVGDKVRKTLQKTSDFNIGDTAVVSEVVDERTIKLNGSSDTYSSSCWEVVQRGAYPNGKHPHHDVILEYAKGAEIEWFNSIYEKWCLTSSPSFGRNTLYRVKPQQDPAVQAAKKKIEQAEQMLREANDELDRLGL
ncbi:hypothetical protein RIO-1_15 [Pseudoalteromonas phage RIO-1]|uniref:Uncharacterized protein n=1 Tax=Pseudoalteromonas phage RIO-1 TaxID=1316739 RepID=R4JKH2_9CAUD|nr:hypothetical protein RIO-1_15 [Pseudoalteromonas phage RIO-1]AGK87029.1 hypothetical protein RIO-1_15 [Pseudoalteromonas phage RIO-1]